MNKTASGQKLLSVKPISLENLNRGYLSMNERVALSYGGMGVIIIVWLLVKFGPPQVWYMDKMISLKLKLYNRFAKEKIEIVEDFKYEELELEERPEKPYVRKRGRIEVESY